MYDRDINTVRFVGSLTVGLGIILMLLTALAVLFGLFTGSLVAPAHIVRGLGSAALSIIMSSTMVGCGAQFQRLRLYSNLDTENLRLVWTALVLVMMVSIIAGYFLLPPLSTLAALVLFGAWTIRGAVLRLTR
jgi:hypothetical protein